MYATSPMHKGLEAVVLKSKYNTVRSPTLLRKATSTVCGLLLLLLLLCGACGPGPCAELLRNHEFINYSSQPSPTALTSLRALLQQHGMLQEDQLQSCRLVERRSSQGKILVGELGKESMSSTRFGSEEAPVLSRRV